MKIIVAFLMICHLRLCSYQALFVPSTFRVEKIETDSFLIEIKHFCEEGCVSCNKIQMKIKKKGDTKIKVVKGATLHTYSKDGKTPVKLLGYKFRRKDSVFYIFTDGFLEIRDLKEKVITAEKFIEKENHNEKRN